MGDFLTEVKTVSFRQKPQKQEFLLEEVTATKPLIEDQSKPEKVDSLEDVLQSLRSRPDSDTLEHVLRWLVAPQRRSDFDIRSPSPNSAKIVNILINTTIPDFWGDLGDLKPLLRRCLRSVAGISAALARLKLLTSQYQPKGADVKNTHAARPIQDQIDVLSAILGTDGLAQRIWTDIDILVSNQAKQNLLWKEFLTTITSGRIVSAVAQAEDTVKSSDINDHVQKRSWLSDGSQYSAWIGRNTVNMVRSSSDPLPETTLKAAAQLCGKSFGIGYSAHLVEELHDGLTLHSTGSIASLGPLLAHFKSHEQKTILNLTMRFMSKRCPTLQAADSERPDGLSPTAPEVAAAAGLLDRMVKDNETMKDQLRDWLADPAASSAADFSIRRAALSALASNSTTSDAFAEDRLETVLENNMRLFGDNLFIKHMSILQHEACAQVLLMAAGYVHRRRPMFVFTLARSSNHISGTSNRMHASSPRARFLGMAVGTAISDLVDKPGSKLQFDVDEMKTPEARWYQQLVKVDDHFGSIESIKSTFRASSSIVVPQKEKIQSKSRQAKKKIEPTKVQTEVEGPRITEILDDEEEEDDDLIPYAKPDSDPEDEDEDPTLVNRNKPKAPVYIRDLMSALHDSENYDRHSTALKSAAALIRRKSSFGKEVKDHTVELASILTNLGDQFDMEDFAELRLQALIAVLLADPAVMAPWFARQVFDGDYSLSQRATVLSVLGLGARELAGYEDEDGKLNPQKASTSFPTKQLPERFHKMYAGENSAAVGRIASNLEKSMIQPMAAKAADSVTGPDILKTRTFSSRMEVEKKRKKAIPNALAKIVAEGFFFPLTGRWWQNMQTYGGNNVHFQPFLLSTYLKTLAILLHASGPGTLSLPQMTAEFWELLLNVRTNALADASVLEAVLFSILTLLDVNEDKRRIAEEHSKDLIETQEWVELVFSRCSGGSDEDEKIRMLAASVLIKTREVVEKFQRLLVGDMLDY